MSKQHARVTETHIIDSGCRCKRCKKKLKLLSDLPIKVEAKITSSLKEPRGFYYIIGYWTPGPDKNGNDFPAQHYFTRIEYRDNLQDAVKIWKVLCETDILHTAYGIILDPVF